MATIRRRTGQGGVSFHVQVRIKGHTPETATFRRLTDARRWAQQTEAAIREGRHFPRSAARAHTLAEAIDRYMKTILPHKAKHTVDVQNPQLAWWQAQIGHLSLADVIPAIVAEQRDILLQRFTPGTVNRYLAALSHVCTIAWREWQWLESNPVHAISKPREPQGRVRYLSDQERQRLLDACKISHNAWLYTIVVLALATGCRKMELLSLRWGDVDLQRGTLTLRDTKNGDTRRVPLVGTALNEMRRHARVRRLDTDLVFPSADGTQPCSIRAAWDTARHQAELRDFRFHDLRHSCASYLAMSGASLLDIKTILGHKSIVMTQRYAHLSQDHTQQVLARMTAQIL